MKMGIVALCGVLMLPGAASAKPIPDSASQIGPWSVGAHTRDNHSDGFGHCAAYRVQSEGFAVAFVYRPEGHWGLVIEAATWNLSQTDTKTVTIEIGAARVFTATAKAVNPRALVVNAAQELYDQLRSGTQFSATVDGRRYSLDLDGIEGVLARVKACVSEHSRLRNAASPAPPGRPGGAPAPTRPEVGAGTMGVRSGTGFFIAPETLVTNFHVVDGCGRLRLHKTGADLGAARVVATNRADDLAVLRSETPVKSFLKLRVGAPIKPAEPVLIFGYPLSVALSSAGNTTLGNVTALAGLRDDLRFIQISAAIQPGNSGGPVLDEAGRLMGVVMSKLDALAVARVTGDIPQNVNFAIKVSTLVNFLEANGIAYEPADPAARELPVTQRAERAQMSSLQVECRK